MTAPTDGKAAPNRSEAVPDHSEAAPDHSEAAPNHSAAAFDELMDGASSARLFFALWPDADTAMRLEEAGAQAHKICGGRRMRCETLHLTLAFLGEIAAERITLLGKVAAAIDVPSFTLRLDELGCWHRIVWAGCTQMPPALSSLAGQLHSSLREAGFSLEDRPFAAHATLLRNARCDSLSRSKLSLPTIDWQVGEFVLALSSRHGAGYTLIGRWPLSPSNTLLAKV